MARSTAATTRKSATAVRGGLSEFVNRAIYRGERTVLQRRGRDVAAIVPIDDLVLLEELADRIDLKAARLALKETEEISLADLKKKLGL